MTKGSSGHVSTLTIICYVVPSFCILVYVCIILRIICGTSQPPSSQGAAAAATAAVAHLGRDCM